MRIVLQRVKKATVTIEDKLYSSIDKGFLVFVGIENEDTNEDVEWLTSKLCGMRIFCR
jgi:D-tyrosyl-tRNA(Tyr) deacylase